MLKTGIHTLNQLVNGPRHGLFGQKRTIAADLYGELSISGIPNKEKLEELVLDSLVFPNGISRQTYDACFEEFDAEAVRQIKKFFEPNALPRIHDAAVSDGRTACDLFEKLKRHFNKLSYHTTDRCTSVKVAKSRSAPDNRLIKDDDGKILQIITPPFVLNIYKKDNPALYPINRLVLKSLSDKEKRRKRMNLENPTEKEMSLFSHKALQLERGDPCFSLGACDLFSESPADYDIIRVMNFMDEKTFDEKNALLIINNLKRSLKDPGILLIGSNKKAGSSTRGNIFLKKNGKMNILSIFGKGAPYQDLFLR